jgi:hypothetical protein
MRKKLQILKKLNIKNFKSWIKSTKLCRWLRQSRRMRIPSTWRSWRSPTPSTRRSFRNYTKRNYSTNSSSYTSWLRTRMLWSRHSTSRSHHWLTSMSSRLKFCFRTSSTIYNGFRNGMSKASVTATD